jgi:hypothetical protein
MGVLNSVAASKLVFAYCWKILLFEKQENERNHLVVFTHLKCNVATC